MDTRPGALSTLEARKIAEQIVAAMETETDFKIEVLLKLERLIVLVEMHEKKIGTINQTIDDSRGIINKIIGGLLLIAAGGGIAAGIAKLIETLRGAQ